MIECVGVEGTHGGCLADTWTHKTLLRKCGIDHHQSVLYNSTLSLIYLYTRIIHSYTRFTYLFPRFTYLFTRFTYVYTRFTFFYLPGLPI